MERRKIDQLWKRDDVRDAEAILGFYQNELSQMVFVGSGEKYDSVPNHQAVTDMNADAKTLRIGTAYEYCHYCKCGIKVLKMLHYNTEAQYLYDYYIWGKRCSQKQELRKLHYSPSSSNVLSELLPVALKEFAVHCPDKYFNELLEYEVSHNKYDEPTGDREKSMSN